MRAKRGVAYLLTCCISFWLLVGITACTKKNVASLSGPKEGLVAEKVKARLVESYGKLPLSFIQNEGQVDGKVKFYERGSGHATFFTEDGIYISLVKGKEDAAKMTAPKPVVTYPEKGEGLPKPEGLTAESVKITLLGANKAPEILAEDMHKGKVNYLIGNNSKKWRTNIPTYGAIVYREVYKGVDIRFLGNNRQLQYDIIVKPGADSSIVRFSYEGIEGLKVTEEGDLEIALKEGKFVQKSPVVYQEINGSRVEVAGSFKVLASNSYGFEVAQYDKKKTLIIDPVLEYSTFLGGTEDDNSYDIAVDASGNAYVTGSTNSLVLPPFPPPVPLVLADGPFQPSLAGGFDAFVVKLNTDGSALEYGTYLGGIGNERGSGITVDNEGNAWVTGYTSSDDFPITEGAFQPALAGESDAFVVKLNANGSDLVYATYLGGSASDLGLGIAQDNNNNVHIAGYTFSDSDFPLSDDAFQSDFGGHLDIFATKLDIDISGEDSLVYSTYLGGDSQEWGPIALDDFGNAYVTGETMSTDFPTVLPLQTDMDGHWRDAFVTKLSPSGSVIFSTYLGGIGSDSASDIDIDIEGNAYIVGSTNANNFPVTENAFQPSLAPPTDAFVAKLAADGSYLVYATYLGGSGISPEGRDGGESIAVDEEGNAYVTGMTSSTNFPTESPVQPANGGGADVFVTKLNADGSSLLYSTYLGGEETDRGPSIAVDDAGNAYVTGITRSPDFPTMSAMQPTLAGNWDSFVTKFALTPQEHIGLIIDEVEDLLAAGVMTQGQCNALIVKLEDAIQHLNRGNKKPAIKKLEDFIHQANNRMQEGTLSLEQGQLLINAASEVLTAL